MISALHYLQSQLQVIHRDVKPSNILISRDGNVKMCDFGISGYLVDSVAKTIDAGCKPYMAVRVSFKPIRKTLNLISAPGIFSPSVSTRKGTPPPTTYAPTSGALVSRCSRFQQGSFRTKHGRRRSSNSSRS